MLPDRAIQGPGQLPRIRTFLYSLLQALCASDLEMAGDPAYSTLLLHFSVSFHFLSPSLSETVKSQRFYPTCTLTGSPATRSQVLAGDPWGHDKGLHYPWQPGARASYLLRPLLPAECPEGDAEVGLDQAEEEGL